MEIRTGLSRTMEPLILTVVGALPAGFFDRVGLSASHLNFSLLHLSQVPEACIALKTPDAGPDDFSFGISVGYFPSFWPYSERLGEARVV